MTPSAAIAIFVKTPGLTPLKTRLAAGIGDAAALAFYRLSLGAVAEVAAEAGLAAYWAVAEEEGIHDPLWDNNPNLWCGDGDLGVRQHHIYTALMTEHDRVLLIGADAPQISPALLADAVSALDAHDFVMGPASDGGYYLFGGKVMLDATVFSGIQWSTGATAGELTARLPAKPAMLPTLTDIDEADNLTALLGEMPENPNREQIALINWVSGITNR